MAVKEHAKDVKAVVRMDAKPHAAVVVAKDAKADATQCVKVIV